MAKYVHILNVRLTDKQRAELETYAQHKEMNVTEVVRDLIVHCLEAEKALV